MKTFSTRRWVICLGIILITGNPVTGLLLAADYTWTNDLATAQSWVTSGNWNPNGIPNAANDTVLLTNVDYQNVQRTINFDRYITASVVRLAAVSNRYLLSLGYTSGREFVMRSSSGNALINISSFTGADPGTYFGNLRIADAGSGGKMRFASDTDIVLTGRYANLTTAVPLLGNATVNLYAWNGAIWRAGSASSPYNGTVNVYGSGAGQLRFDDTGYELSNAAAVVVYAGGRLSFGDSGSGQRNYTAPLVLNGGTMYRQAATPNLKNITVRSGGTIDCNWGTIYLNGAISGTGTVTLSNGGQLNICGCDIKPGFSIGILTINRTGPTFTFATNAVTLYVELNGEGGVAGSNYDQLNVTGLEAGREVDLSNVNVVLTGTGTGVSTNWFFTANRIVNGSTLGSVSNAPTLTSTIVYDYTGGRVGAIVMPEPTSVLLLLALGARLRRSRRR